MFKNLILYRAQPIAFDLSAACGHLAAAAFEPCGPSQEKSAGFIPPREANGSMVEAIDGQWIMKLMTETKAVPADVVNRQAAEHCAKIERLFGRKPGKKETRDIKDEIRLDLLPHAFPKQAATLIWLDTKTNLLAIGASSQSRADEAVTLLVQALPGFAVTLAGTQTSPAASMAEWLLNQEAQAGFRVDRECELKAADESKAVVKYGKHRLDIDEVPDHIRAGKMPSKLAMTWNERVSFVLTDTLQIKKLAFLDVVFEGSDGKHADDFDANVTIATGELRELLPDLFDALGGEAVAA